MGNVPLFNQALPTICLWKNSALQLGLFHDFCHPLIKTFVGRQPHGGNGLWAVVVILKLYTSCACVIPGFSWCLLGRGT